MDVRLAQGVRVGIKNLTARATGRLALVDEHLLHAQRLRPAAHRMGADAIAYRTSDDQVVVILGSGHRISHMLDGGRVHGAAVPTPHGVIVQNLPLGGAGVVADVNTHGFHSRAKEALPLPAVNVVALPATRPVAPEKLTSSDERLLLVMFMAL